MNWFRKRSIWNCFKISIFFISLYDHKSSFSKCGPFLSHDVLLTFLVLPHLNVNTDWSGWTWMENLNICVSAAPLTIPSSLKFFNYCGISSNKIFLWSPSLRDFISLITWNQFCSSVLLQLTPFIRYVMLITDDARMIQKRSIFIRT